MASLRAAPAPGPVGPATLGPRAVVTLAAAQTAPSTKHARLDGERPRAHGAVVLTTGLAAAVAGSATVRSRWSKGRRGQRLPTSRWAYSTGPGWTDEVARIFDPRPEGPQWEEDVGYRGRGRLRVLLDGEDLAHSYAKARYEQTGKWTGPLSEGIEQALMYGAWRGPDAEEDAPEMEPDASGVIMESPEIMTFVGMPVDLIQSVKPGNICDGFPEDVREEIGRAVFGEDGTFVNDWLRQLQDINRLITWTRPTVPGHERNSLIKQKYFEDDEVKIVRGSKVPVLLTQVMGAGTALGLGDRVEALKPGRFINDQWVPAKWEEAQVMAANYDGTYDLQFIVPFGPYYHQVENERALKIPGITKPRLYAKTPPLPKGKFMMYYNSGADPLPAQFRLMLEMNFMQGVSPASIRLKRSLERLSDTTVDEGNQDWYLVSNKQHKCAARSSGMIKNRIMEYSGKFNIRYKWVETPDGDLRFEPVPTEKIALGLRASHRRIAEKFAETSVADAADRKSLARIKAEMDNLLLEVERSGMFDDEEDDEPIRPSGPLEAYKTKSLS